MNSSRSIPRRCVKACWEKDGFGALGKCDVCKPRREQAQCRVKIIAPSQRMELNDPGYPQSYDGPNTRSDTFRDDRYERINSVFSLRIDALSTDPSKLWDKLVTESTPLSALAHDKGLTNFEEMETWLRKNQEYKSDPAATEDSTVVNRTRLDELDSVLSHRDTERMKKQADERNKVPMPPTPPKDKRYTMVRGGLQGRYERFVVAADLDAIDDDEPTSLGVSSNRHSHTLSSCARPPRPIRFAYTGGCGAPE